MDLTKALNWYGKQYLLVKPINIYFDWRHNIDTFRFIELQSMDGSPETVARGQPHYPSPSKSFRIMMDRMLIDHSQFTFIDIGAGLGRTILMASLYPFKRIIGVEFVESMVDMANRNIASFRHRKQQCTNIEMVCADATRYTYPAENLVIFFYNPFDITLLRRALKNIEKIDPANEVYIVYYKTLNVEAFDENRSLECLYRSEVLKDWGAREKRRFNLYRRIIGKDAGLVETAAE